MFKLINKIYHQQTLRIPMQFCMKHTGNQNATNVSSSPNPNVPGLSEKCVAIPKQPVGPNASKDKEYKNPEYFCYHVDSFAEAEVELAKFRLPVPSNKSKHA
ncbi:hypothetical protein PV327_002629 [Microctonus hyperodae]|uniref:NADH dehydrogenase [ubiquinone] flavoprotein 3, mitochondrial n=1 Tax=Microctonus hyperodae TaxID=165561 RepID=A0AA39KPB0_MICHY|nr:hypothetical protein PV327_002629 [Microctonus hyperodae]